MRRGFLFLLSNVVLDTLGIGRAHSRGETSVGESCKYSQRALGSWGFWFSRKSKGVFPVVRMATLAHPKSGCSWIGL